MPRPETGDRLPLAELLRQAAMGSTPSSVLEALIDRMAEVRA
ncbi:hypothetical protein [Pseudogemmobacter sonorensis]